MESYRLNYKLSKKIYKHHKQKIRLNMCYMNIYLIRNCLELSGYNYKIAYGYMLDKQNIYTKHCFILLADNTIVDPTVFIFGCVEDIVRYFIIKTFGLMEYMEEIIKNEETLNIGKYKRQQLEKYCILDVAYYHKVKNYGKYILARNYNFESFLDLVGADIDALLKAKKTKK